MGIQSARDFICDGRREGGEGRPGESGSSLTNHCSETP